MHHGAYSDGRLLAFLDGELAPAEEQDLRRHLDACWECRARVAELEEDVHDVTRACQDGGWYSPTSLERSRRRLHAAIEAEPPARRGFGRYLVPLAAASLAFAGGAVWYTVQPSPAEPVEYVVRSLPTPPPKIAIPKTEPAPPPSAAVALENVRAPMQADLFGVLFDVHEALHRAGACTQEQPSVRIENGKVRVRLLAATKERHDEVASALAALNAPGLDLDLTSMDDAAGSQQEVVFVPGAGAATPATGRRLPIHDTLVQYLRRDQEPTEREVRDFADSVLRSSELLNLQHRALIALAEAFPEQAEVALPTPARERLGRLVRSHQDQLRAAERILRSSLEPLAGTAAQRASEEPKSWQADTRTSAVPELHRHLIRLFAVPVGEPVRESRGVEELQDLLAQPLVSNRTALAGR